MAQRNGRRLSSLKFLPNPARGIQRVSSWASLFLVCERCQVAGHSCSCPGDGALGCPVPSFPVPAHLHNEDPELVAICRHCQLANLRDILFHVFKESDSGQVYRHSPCIGDGPRGRYLCFLAGNLSSCYWMALAKGNHLQGWALEDVAGKCTSWWPFSDQTGPGN